jgi:hypothetical protein
MTTGTIEKVKQSEESQTQKEMRGLLEAAITAVKNRDRKQLWTMLSKAMARVDEL